VTALGVYVDPDGWQNAGYTIRAAVDQLTQELDSADAGGGSGLRRTWSGPVADAFQNHWSGRYDRYGDLLYQAGRAANALIDFGGRLIDLQRQASLLEHQGLSAGLHLTMDGLGFMLPFGHENLVQEAQATLHYFLGESEREIAAMWTDIRMAVCDVVTVLESVSGALEDFQLLALDVTGDVVEWAVRGAVNDFIKDPLSVAGDFLDDEFKVFEIRAAHNEAVAKLLAKDWAGDADSDLRAAASSLVDDAESEVGVVKSYGEFVGHADIALAAVGAVVTIGETYVIACKQGWVSAFEDRAGDWARLAVAPVVGAGVDALLGTAAVAGIVASVPFLATVGVVVVTGIVCVGVGDIVQHEVDHHRAGTSRVLTDIGHEAEQAAIWSATETGLIPQSAS
jgi:hypothetical protein